MKRLPLGSIIAGGASSRFGSPKALAEVGGVRIIDRVAAAIARVTPDIVVIANDAEIAGAVPFETRSDVIAGAGVLAGVLTALLWAQERSIDWILSVACDMPFLRPELLQLIAGRTLDADADLIAPESDGPRGLEPLCAAYRTTCIEPIRSALDRGDPRMIGFHADVTVQILAMREFTSFGEPGILFMNVNTPAELQRAEEIARGAP